MAEFPSFISLSSLDGSTGFKIRGEAAKDYSGSSVSGAGDVNGDGFDDVIIGAGGADPNGDRSGASYVVFGKASGFAATLDLSTLDGSTGLKIRGEADDDISGVVSSAGDVNGDGFDDLIIGAPGVGQNHGASYVVFGKASGFTATLDLSTLDGSTGFKITGEAAKDNSGTSVSDAGDVNGDGFDDLIIGASRADPNGDSSGASYVVFGKASGFAANLDLSTLDGSTGFKIRGEAAQDYSGGSVSSAGDVNGDGFDDLIIGAQLANPNGSNSGASYVVFGKASGFATTLDLSTLDGSTGFKVKGESRHDTSGRSVSSAGDVNRDGFDDLIIGAPGARGQSGVSYVVFGKALGFAATLDLSTLDGSNGFKIRGEAANDFSGLSVSSAGDVNGDGFDDLIIGAPFADSKGGDSGASYVVFGKASGFAARLDLSTLDGNTGFQIRGEASGDITGMPISSAGDVNGDGFDDLIIGAPHRGLSGASYVVFGHRALEAVTRIGTDIAQTINGGNDSVDGLGGDDTLIGWERRDSIVGGAGNDTIDGGDGSDLMDGGLGGDVFIVSVGEDTANGSSGSDRLDFTQLGSAQGLIVDLNTGIVVLPEGLGSIAFSSIERVTGNDGDDDFIGTAAANSFRGLGGDDSIVGGAGNDLIFGGAGNDTLIGGAGRDELTGGGGQDVFAYNDVTDSSVAAVHRDTIVDFEVNVDRIDLSSIDATAGGGNSQFTFIGIEAFTGLGQARFFQQGGNTFVEMNTVGDLTADMAIKLSGLITLDALDFVL